MIVDGRAIAGDILRETRGKVAALGRAVVVRAVVVSPSPATHSYLRVKSARAEDAGMQLNVVHLPDDASAKDVIAAVRAPGADAVIVQLPLPAHLEPEQDVILEAIPVAQDADVLSEAAYARFAHQESGALVPPVASAVAEILLRSGVDVAGKRALVVGAGQLVGQPVFEWLQHQGASAIAVTKTSASALPQLAPQMDIVVSGAGAPGIIRPELLKQGAVVIDAGTSESNGEVVGDADPACAAVASVFTPVPGGVGPVAVAYLFKNAAELAMAAQAGAAGGGESPALTNPAA